MLRCYFILISYICRNVVEVNTVVISMALETRALVKDKIICAWVMKLEIPPFT